MEEKELKAWQCKSKVILGKVCSYDCNVVAPFKPEGCLLTSVYEEWEEIDQETTRQQE